MLEDHQIIRLLEEKSETAISELNAKYGRLCFHIAENILGNPEDAEECVSNALFCLWSLIPPEKPDKLSPYLCRIVRNQALKRLHFLTASKRGGENIPLAEIEDFLAGSRDVEHDYGAAELKEHINLFLCALAPKQRALFVRRYWYCDSVTQLSERFYMSESNISSTLLRIRKKLKKHLMRNNLL